MAIPTLSIVIVKYKSDDYLPQCLKSIGTEDRWETIVIDNDVDNIGYGPACNKGAQKARGKYILFLNPDTLVTPAALKKMISYLDHHPQVAVMGPKLLLEEGGETQLSCCRFPGFLTAIIAFSPLKKIFPNNFLWKNYVYDDELKSGKPISVDAVSGAALLIRKTVFFEVDGFDKNIFLYFEENDLCRKVQKTQRLIVYNPEIEILHFGGKSTHDLPRSEKYFQKSRRYFFSKHYSRTGGLLLNFCFSSLDILSKLSLADLCALILIAVAFFLRLYKLDSNFAFGGELGDNLLSVKSFIEKGAIPLIGPPTSHPWLSFAPAFYWILGLVLLITRFNPLSPVYITVITGGFIVLINYVFVKRLFGSVTALISSFLIAIAPLFVDFSRSGRFMLLVTPLSYAFLWFLYRLWSRQLNTKGFFALGTVFGLMLNFHLTPLVLLLPLILFGWKYRSWRNFTIFTAGSLIPLFPLIIHDVLNGFSMLPKLIVWLPYRVLSTLGVIHLNADVAGRTDFGGLIRFISSSFSPSQSLFLFIVLSGFLILSVIWLVRSSGSSTGRLLSVTFCLSVAGLLVHGSPPFHYFVPILTLPVILISLFLSQLLRYKWGLIAVVSTLLLAGYSNLRYYFSPSFYFLPQVVDQRTMVIPYRVQVDAIDYINRDSGKVPYALRRVGPLDEYNLNFAQNYLYLADISGHKADPEAPIEYIIVEDERKLDNQNAKSYYLGEIRGLKIYKHEK